MVKVAVLGVDGLDPVLYRRWRGRLPHLDRLADSGLFSELESVIPPDSVPAWISIYTGLPPTRHGVLHSFHHLDQGKQDFKVDPGVFRGRTFWDYAGTAGRKVAVLNPFVAYPAWPVNGIMVSGPVFEGGETTAVPDGILERYPFPPIGGIVDFPRKQELPGFVEKTRALTERQVEAFLRVARGEEWDLLFITLLTFDRLAHFTWRHTDPADPTYPGETGLEDTIFEAYRQLDRAVGLLDQIVPSDAELLVVSDHGHGQRSTRVFNVNEYLRRKGYLQSTVGKAPLLSRRYWVEVLKVKVLEFLDRHELQDLAFRIARWIPNRRALKHSTDVTDPTASLAAAPDFDGTNPFGGIEIRPEACRQRGVEAEALRRELAADLARLIDPTTGKRMLRWVRPREEVYAEGEFLERYPELLFELEPEYGVSWNLFGPLVGTNPTHRKISGGHRRMGVLFSRQLGPPADGSTPGVLQLAPSILRLLGVPIPAPMQCPALPIRESPAIRKT